jgi:hypothetical protein
MKYLAPLVLAFGIVALLPALAQAQQAYQADRNRGQQLIKEAFPRGQRGFRETPPVKVEPFDPKPAGIVPSVIENGAIFLSPLAPMSYGLGQQFLTKYWEQAKFSTESGANTNPPYGGLILFGIDF